MHLKSRILTPGSGMGVTLVEFKEHIKWDATDTSEDASMAIYIKAATLQAEAFTRRVIGTTVWQTFIDWFYGTVRLDVIPIVTSTGFTVKYYDVNDALQTLASSEYTIINNGTDDFIEIEFDGTMPEIYDRVEPIVIEYTAGYATVPDAIKLGILMQAATYFEGRQNEVVGADSNMIMFGSHQVWYPYKMMG